VSRLGIEPALEGMLTQVTADTTLRMGLFLAVSPCRHGSGLSARYGQA